MTKDVFQVFGFSQRLLPLGMEPGGYVFQEIFSHEFLSFYHFQESFNCLRVAGGVDIESKIFLFDLVCEDWKVQILNGADDWLIVFIICCGEFKNSLKPLYRDPELLVYWFLGSFHMISFDVLRWQMLTARIHCPLKLLVIVKFNLALFLIRIVILIWNYVVDLSHWLFICQIAWGGFKR